MKSNTLKLSYKLRVVIFLKIATPKYACFFGDNYIKFLMPVVFYSGGLI
ncbi:MAG: hypothetical protein ABJF04_16355 [Reichenbachiella sp.]